MADTEKRVTRDDLEAKFRQLQDGVQSEIDSRKPTMLIGAVAGGMLLLLIVFLLGRRAGNRKTTLVEIRRV